MFKSINSNRFKEQREGGRKIIQYSKGCELLLMPVSVSPYGGEGQGEEGRVGEELH